MGNVTPEWTAGFFDGEGTVDIRLRKTHGGKYLRFELRVQIVQRDVRPLHLIAARFGGSVQKAKTGSCAAWVASGACAGAFLARIERFVIAKSDQVAVALAFAALPAGVRGKFHSQEAIDARLALMSQLRGIRDHAGLTPKARNHSLQAAASVFALPHDPQALAGSGGPPKSRQDRGLH